MIVYSSSICNSLKLECPQDLKAIMLSEKWQSWRVTYCVILFTRCSWNDEIIEIKNKLGIKQRRFLWWLNSCISWLQWWLDESIHVKKLCRPKHTHCINFLILQLYYSWVRYNHIFATSCEVILITQKLETFKKQWKARQNFTSLFLFFYFYFYSLSTQK